MKKASDLRDHPAFSQGLAGSVSWLTASVTHAYWRIYLFIHSFKPEGHRGCDGAEVEGDFGHVEVVVAAPRRQQGLLLLVQQHLALVHDLRALLSSFPAPGVVLVAIQD